MKKEDLVWKNEDAFFELRKFKMEKGIDVADDNFQGMSTIEYQTHLENINKIASSVGTGATLKDALNTMGDSNPSGPKLS